MTIDPTNPNVRVPVSARGQKRAARFTKRLTGLTDLTVGQAAKPEGTRIARHAGSVAHDPERQGLDTQIILLRDEINRNLRRIAALVQSGALEKAAVTCSIVSTQRNRIAFLANEYGQRTMADAVPEPQATDRAPRIRMAPRKIKRYPNHEWKK